MSVIALKGIPAQWPLVEVAKATAKLVAGPFEPLNFSPTKANKKTCYLRLSARLDPIRVVEKLNSATIKGLKLVAYVPEHVPDLPIKKSMVSQKLGKSFKMKFPLPNMVVVIVHAEIFTETQFRFPGLYNLSRKTGHKLLDEISQVIAERLKRIGDEEPESTHQMFQMSKTYRQKHPHSGDFQLIVSTLHRLQDANGAPRAEIDEAELQRAGEEPGAIENIPLEKVKVVCRQLGDRINSAVTTHVQWLDSEISSADSKEDIARKKVREELKKMLPYIPAALKQVVASHFIPEEQPFRKIRIYGEPFLPGRDQMSPFTKKYKAPGSKIIRSQRMYNLLLFKVNSANYSALKAMDATVINGAKLTIRSDIPLRDVNPALRNNLAKHFGGTVADAEAMAVDEDEFELDDGEE